MSRTVLVTGASSGIGRAVALELASRGDQLVLLARRVDALEAVASACRARGAGSVSVRPCDVADRAALELAFDTFTRLDAVVHAAAVAAYGRFTEIPGDVFDRVQEVNLLGTANVSRAAIGRFETQGAGHLVLFGSVLGKTAAPYLSPYVTSKWGVHGLARTLQGELRVPSVSVSVVEPGGVDTTLYEKAASYLGVQGKPPPPVMTAEQVARATVNVLDHPRRERSVGKANPLLTWGFRLVPAAYDAVVAPVMSRIGLAERPVADHRGNLFDPVAEPTPEEVRDARRS
ncbi:MAG TPA: SDR family NAD(P)-dependent oxidoreductase [Nocardioidaceae bacterium]|nr:SDR family NAD(P)-dependent oxidoreductase [Nocardioidaceae bacterium]